MKRSPAITASSRPRSRATSSDSPPRPVAGGEDGGQVCRSNACACPRPRLPGSPPVAGEDPGRWVPGRAQLSGKAGPEARRGHRGRGVRRGSAMKRSPSITASRRPRSRATSTDSTPRPPRRGRWLGGSDGAQVRRTRTPAAAGRCVPPPGTAACPLGGGLGGRAGRPPKGVPPASNPPPRRLGPPAVGSFGITFSGGLTGRACPSRPPAAGWRPGTPRRNAPPSARPPARCRSSPAQFTPPLPLQVHPQLAPTAALHRQLLELYPLQLVPVAL